MYSKQQYPAAQSLTDAKTYDFLMMNMILTKNMIQLRKVLYSKKISHRRKIKYQKFRINTRVEKINNNKVITFSAIGKLFCAWSKRKLTKFGCYVLHYRNKIQQQRNEILMKMMEQGQVAAFE